MFGIAATLVTSAAIVALMLRIDNWSRDFTENFAKIEPIIFSAEVDEVSAKLERWVREKPNWKLESKTRTEDGAIDLHFTRTTKMFRFVDDIRVHLSPDAVSSDTVGTHMEAESRSRIGKGDLGQNPRNLKELTSTL